MDPPDILFWCCSRQLWCLNWKRPGAVSVEFSMARQWGDTAILSIFFWYWYGFLFQCRVFPAYNFLHYQYKSTNNLHLHLQDAADVGPKNNADKLSRWFSVMLVPKLLLTPIKIRIFGPKTAKFGPKSAFLVILGQILPFFAHFVQWPTKNNVYKVPRWVFRYVGNKTYDSSSKKKDFLPQNDKIWPKLGIFGWYGPGHAGFFGALLVGQLAVVARGLYLARHLFTLSYIKAL